VRAAERWEAILEAVRRAGYANPSYYVHRDETSNLAYSYYLQTPGADRQPIQVWQEETPGGGGSLREIASLSRVLAGISTDRVTRHVLFVPEEALPAVRNLLT
jgi:hypothetical protein